MINSISQGNTIEFLATKDIKAGEVLTKGNISGVAVSDYETGGKAVISTVGVYELEKAIGESFGLGQRLYINIENKLSVNKSGIFVGHCWGEYSENDSYANVRISYYGNNETEGIVYVDNKYKFPIAENGIITPVTGIHYVITKEVDLEGDRLFWQGKGALFGLNSETCCLKSTGLGAGNPLIKSGFDLPMQNLEIVADWAVDIDGLGNECALDWKALNFNNTPRVGIVKDVSNFIYESSAFLNSAGLSIDGTIGTIGIETSLLQGNGLATDIIKIEDTCIIQRRFRSIFSSFVAFGSQTAAINFSSLATVPSDSYILFKCNFSGGGSYLKGVGALDNKANFDGNKGIENSGSIFSYYMIDNATPTPIPTPGEYEKILGTTIDGPINQRFTLSNNRATNAGELSGFYKISGTVSLTSGNNNQLGVRVAFNGVDLESSQSRTTANGSGRAENITFFGVVEITGGVPDYIEIFATNYTSGNAVTGIDLNVLGERAN